MNVVVCKFSSYELVDRQVAMQVSLLQKRFGRKPRVICVEEQVSERLKSAGVNAEFLDEFQQYLGFDDELSWEEFYHISDEFHKNAQTNHKLWYFGINFLTLDFNNIEYVFAVKFSKLCQRMITEECGAFVLVLTGAFVGWFPNIKSPSIKTLKFEQTNSLSSFKRQLLALLKCGYDLLFFLVDRLKMLKTNTNAVQADGKTSEPPSVIFVVSMTIPYARPALAVYDECLRNGLSPFVLTDDYSLIPLLRLHRVKYAIKPPPLISIILYPYQVANVILILLRLRNHLQRYVRDICQHSPEINEFSAVNICKQILQDRLLAFCHEAITDIDFLNKFIKKHPPDIICLMPQSSFLQQMASALAKVRYRIPTLASSAAWETADARAFRAHLYADKISVMGERLKEIYEESGVEPSRIVVTGIAHFDLLFNRNLEQDNRILSEYGIDPESRIIVFTTQNISGGETEKALVGTIQAILKNEDVHLVVKVHPQEDIAICRSIVEKFNNPRLHVVKDIEVYALINRCELLITKHSTTALEAILANKPVITVNLSGKQTSVVYAEEGATIGVERYEDIEPSIFKALYDDEARTSLRLARNIFLQRWAGKPDGHSSLRIVNLMKEMFSSQNT